MYCFQQCIVISVCSNIICRWRVVSCRGDIESTSLDACRASAFGVKSGFRATFLRALHLHAYVVDIAVTMLAAAETAHCGK